MLGGWIAARLRVLEAAQFEPLLVLLRPSKQSRPEGREVPLTPRFRRSGIVRVKNESGADHARFNILGIDAPIFTPTDNEDTFKNHLALTGTTPDEDDHVGRFAILLEPIPDGKIGLACLDGVCPVKVDVEDENHEYADVADAEAGKLKSGLRGAAQNLWKESGTGEKWAVVRVGPSTH